MSDLLQQLGGLIFDIDGSLVRGGQAIPGVPEAIRRLRNRGIRIAVFTNDNMKLPSDHATRLRGMGIEIETGEVLSSSIVAAEYVGEKFPAAKVLAIGTGEFMEVLEARGLSLVDCGRASEADVVVMGKDPDFGYGKLEAVCKAIWRGAEFIATNLDRRVPVADGFVPGTGAMVKAVVWATEKEPLIMGKPSRWSGEMALKLMGIAREKVAVVGDQLEIDIEMGKAAGTFTILVLTGATKEEELKDVPERLRPDLVLPDVTYLVK